MNNLAAAILAGGKAHRMGGSAKGNLKIKNGVTIVAHLLHELSAIGISATVINTNNFAVYEQYGLPLIADNYLDQGPLGGIATVLEHLSSQYDAVLFLPCDMPNITAELLLKLKAAYLSTNSPTLSLFYLATPTRSHPLCAIVGRALLPKIVAALAAGELKVETLWHRLGGQKLLIEDEASLLNINTLADVSS